MEFEMLRFAVCFIGCTAATYYDVFNRRNVPSWLTYLLVALGIIFTLASFNASLIAQSFLIALVIFIFGYILYRAGQIGGADVLIFVSIALLLPEAPQPIFGTAKPQSYPFVLSVFILSGMLGVFGIFLKYVPKVLGEFLKGEKVKVNSASVALAVVTMLLYSVFLFYLNSIVELPGAQLAIFIGVVVCATSLFALKDHISEKYMIRMVRIDEIDEEDILAIEKMDQRLVSKYKLDRLLTPSEIEKLKKIGRRKKFPVYKEMPVFMPYVLLALVASLLFGDPLTYLYPLSFRE
jgi:Flp pilus assembly protein protease CpaA